MPKNSIDITWHGCCKSSPVMLQSWIMSQVGLKMNHQSTCASEKACSFWHSAFWCQTTNCCIAKQFFSSWLHSTRPWRSLHPKNLEQTGRLCFHWSQSQQGWTRKNFLQVELFSNPADTNSTKVKFTFNALDAGNKTPAVRALRSSPYQDLIRTKSRWVKR